MGSRTSFACVESRARRDVSWDTSTHTAAARGVRAAVGGTSSLSSQQHAVELAKLRQRNYELSSQLNEAGAKLIEKNQQLDEIKRQYETMLRNLREEVIEAQNQASPSEIDVILMVRLLRRAELNDAKIVPIINKLFPPPEGHKSWTKLLLPKEESH